MKPKREPKGIVVGVRRTGFSTDYIVGGSFICEAQWLRAGGLKLKPDEIAEVRVQVICERVKPRRARGK